MTCRMHHLGPLPPSGGRSRRYDLAGMMERFASVFGREAMMPRIFERASLLGGDVVRDYLHACGLGAFDPGEVPRVKRPVLRADVQELLRRFNERVERLAPADRPRAGLLSSFLDDPRFHGRPRLPTRADAVAFYERFRDGNERIRVRGVCLARSAPDRSLRPSPAGGRR